jgi:hypothetical protein
MDVEEKSIARIQFVHAYPPKGSDLPDVYELNVSIEKLKVSVNTNHKS